MGVFFGDNVSCPVGVPTIMVKGVLIEINAFL